MAQTKKEADLVAVVGREILKRMSKEGSELVRLRGECVNLRAELRELQRENAVLRKDLDNVTPTDEDWLWLEEIMQEMEHVLESVKDLYNTKLGDLDLDNSDACFGASENLKSIHKRLKKIEKKTIQL